MSVLGGMLSRASRTLPVPIPDAQLISSWRALRADPLWRGEGVEHGSGPVLLVAGFGAPAPAMRPLCGWLGRLGYDARVASLDWGLGCGERSSAALRDQIAAWSSEAGRPVKLVAHSRGGQFARVAALRQPSSVAGLVTVGTPFEPLGLQPTVIQQVKLVAALGSLGVPRLASRNCLRGECCSGFASDLAAPWPSSIPLTCIYSCEDQTVLWDLCTDPAGDPIEVRGGHTAMLLNTEALGAVANALAVTF